MKHQLTWKRSLLTMMAATQCLLSSPVFAHHPMGGAMPETFSQGFLSGLGHPIIGLDHFAFLIMAILLTGVLKDRTRYMIPLAFVGGSFSGTVLHLGSANIPMSESLVAFSVLVVAVLVLFRKNYGALALGLLFVLSGILHGYSLGESVIGAETTPLLAYLLGLAAIQYTLIVGGIFLLNKLTGISEKLRSRTERIVSVVTFMIGSAFLVSSLV